MHPKISVAVPTRHRPGQICNFIMSLYTSTNKNPHLTVIYDAPEARCSSENLILPQHNQIKLHHKSSLAELYNLGIVTSPTDWVPLCNDDIEFKDGWIDYLEEKIKEGNHIIIELFHYGAI